MSRNFLYGLKTKSLSHSSAARDRHGRNRRPFGLERLEDRMMLSGGPTIFTVTDTSGLSTDTGSLVFALKEAIANPNPAGSLIEFSTPLFSTPQTITLTNTLDLFGSAGPITIDGPGANLLTVSGRNAVEVFEVDFDATAVISGLTITGGTAAREGGGIFNDGHLTLLNSTVTGNTISGSDGEGGGIINEGDMTISGCTITNNEVSGRDGFGGGVCNESGWTISGSTITNNEISGSDGEGGGVFTDDVLTIANSTVDNNSVSGTDGEGGGIFNDESLVVTASTIAMNSAGSEGGGIWNEDLLTISDSTVAGNTAGTEGGGIYTEDSLTAVNTTIADNSVTTASGGGGCSFFRAMRQTWTTRSSLSTPRAQFPTMCMERFPQPALSI